MTRAPIALANWKTEMAIADRPAFLDHFLAQAGFLPQVQVILCPPAQRCMPWPRRRGMAPFLDHIAVNKKAAACRQGGWSG